MIEQTTMAQPPIWAFKAQLPYVALYESRKPKKIGFSETRRCWGRQDPWDHLPTRDSCPCCSRDTQSRLPRLPETAEKTPQPLGSPRQSSLAHSKQASLLLTQTFYSLSFDFCPSPTLPTAMPLSHPAGCHLLRASRRSSTQQARLCSRLPGNTRFAQSGTINALSRGPTRHKFTSQNINFNPSVPGGNTGAPSSFLLS